MNSSDIVINASEVMDYVYCRRRWFLKHIEFEDPDDNIYMVEGKILHENVETNNVFHNEYGITYTNFACYKENPKLYGICDEVRFLYSPIGSFINMIKERAVVCPVELKHGKIRDCNEYKAQLCIYALCLESMFDCKIQRGILKYTDQEIYIDINIKLRTMALNAIDDIKRIKRSGDIIHANYGRKCRGCSLSSTCQPRHNNITRYIDMLWRDE